MTINIQSRPTPIQWIETIPPGRRMTEEGEVRVTEEGETRVIEEE
jgi:hypothetical protein